MISITPKDIQVTKNDVTLAATVVVVSNLVSNQLSKTPLFNEEWKNVSLATVIGFAIHGLVTHHLSTMVNEQLELTERGMQQSVYDLFKFGTVFLSQKYVTAYLTNTTAVLDEKWMMNSGLTIAGYALFNTMVEDNMPSFGKNQALANDLVKVSMGALLANLVVDKQINEAHLMSLAATLAGFTVFHLVTKAWVAPKEGAGSKTVVSGPAKVVVTQTAASKKR